MTYLFCLLLIHVFCGSYEYAVVIDAGSTGSRWALYSWTSGKMLETIHQMKHQDGLNDTQLSIYKDDVNGLESAFFSFVQGVFGDLADDKLPKSEESKTWFFLGATAGLRVLTTQQAKRIIIEVRRIVNSRFSFKYKDRNMRIISGEEEGLFGWISVQVFLNNKFKDNEVVAAFDMGGASTQVTFLPDEDILASKFTVKFDENTLDAYTHSFLKYGGNEALKTSKDLLILDNPGKTEIIHPCYFKGFNDTYEPSGIVFYGNSNTSACRNLMKRVLNLNQYCFYPRCAFDAVYIPDIPSSKSLYAFSGFYYTVLATGLSTGVDANTTIGQVLDYADKVCSMNYTYAYTYTEQTKPNSFFNTKCFDLYHRMLTLHEGYNITLDSEKIKFVNRVNGEKMSWTLGMLLYEYEYLDFRNANSNPQVVNIIQDCNEGNQVGWSLMMIVMLFFVFV